MDKTHNISLGGFAFQIDDAAYSILNKYLRDIRISLSNSTGVDEIISDVEFRMAELLRQRMMAREVVNVSDVDYLISVMGTPADFYTDEFIDDGEGAERETGAHARSAYSRTDKKLFRDPDDKMLGGVCSGLGHYLGIDTVWIRLVLVLLPFLDFMFLGISTGSVILMYIILWIVVPEAKTTTDKLQMRGEPVNFDSIKDFFGNSPENLRNNINDLGNDARRVADSSGNVIGNIFRVLIKAFVILVIVILLITTLSILAAFVFALFGLGTAGIGAGMTGIAYGSQLSYLFDNGWEKIIGFISLAFVLLLPAIGLMLVAMRLISPRYRVPRFIGFSLPFLWFVGFIGCIIVSSTTAVAFKQKNVDIKTVPIPTDAATIILERSAEDDDSYDLDDLFSQKEGYLAIPLDDDLMVKKSKTGAAYIELKYKSRGRTKADANQNIEHIEFNYEVKDSLVRLDNFIYIAEGNKWRTQYVEPTLYLPEDKMVKFINYDDVESDEEGSFTWHSVNSEKIFKFDNNLFTCINCPDEVIVERVEESATSIEGVKQSIDDQDSITLKTKSNDTGHHNDIQRNDSISD